MTAFFPTVRVTLVPSSSPQRWLVAPSVEGSSLPGDGSDIVSWLKKLLGGAESQDEHRGSASSEGEPPWISGDPPVPPLHIRERHGTYTLNDGREGFVTGFELRTDDGRLLYDNRCGVSRWDHLGLYRPEVVGESYRDQADLSAARAGAAAHLVLEPDNPHDSGAVKVVTGGRHVGYIKKSNQRSLHRVFKAASDEVHVVVWNVHQSRDQEVVAVEVMIVRPGAVVSSPMDLGALHGAIT